MEEIKTDLSGRNLRNTTVNQFGERTSWFEAVLTDKNELMILHHTPIDYDGIVLDLDGTSALDKLLAEMYRRKMNE